MSRHWYGRPLLSDALDHLIHSLIRTSPNHAGYRSFWQWLTEREKEKAVFLDWIKKKLKDDMHSLSLNSILIPISQCIQFYQKAVRRHDGSFLLNRLISYRSWFISYTDSTIRYRRLTVDGRSLLPSNLFWRKVIKSKLCRRSSSKMSFIPFALWLYFM